MKRSDWNEMTGEEKTSWIAPIILIILFVTIGAVVVINFFANTNKYNEAIEFKNLGKYEEAYKIFIGIDNFKDSKKMLKEIEQIYPEIIKNYEPTKTFVFGEYEQDNNIENGKEPIEWIVLENNDGEIYAISKYVLDVQPFNKVNSRNCTLDDWLETTFAQNAFDSTYLQMVTRVEILNVDYFKKDIIEGEKEAQIRNMASLTPYALSLCPEDCIDASYGDGCYAWWVFTGDLEDSERSDTIFAPAICTKTHGTNDFNPVTELNGVRPAIWLFADKDNIPKKPSFSGSSNRGSSSGGSGSSSKKCTSCNGSGKKLVEWYTFGDWGDVSYTSYDCPDCNGTGKK